MPPHAVAWHDKNRGGIGPSGDCTEQLACELVGKYDAKEANHACVSVEIAPKDMKKVERRMKRYSDDDPRLAVRLGPFAVQAIGHAHLNLFLRNINGRVQVSVHLHKELWVKNGRASIDH